MQTIRQQMITLLSQAAHSALDLSHILSIQEKEVHGHLSHVARSVVSQGRRLMVIPSRCLECEYVFDKRQRFSRPGRCPRCKGERIEHPRYQIL